MEKRFGGIGTGTEEDEEYAEILDIGLDLYAASKDILYAGHPAIIRHVKKLKKVFGKWNGSNSHIRKKIKEVLLEVQEFL